MIVMEVHSPSVSASSCSFGGILPLRRLGSLASSHNNRRRSSIMSTDLGPGSGYVNSEWGPGGR